MRRPSSLASGLWSPRTRGPCLRSRTIDAVTEPGAPLASAPYDVVVVGAGVAGTAAAYLASQRHPAWRCLLLEQSSRVGGRLLSLAWPGVEGVRAELGGMRFRTSQPLISALVDELGL